MATIPDLLARAAALREETALNSISPERAGGIMYDTIMAINELWLQQGSALVISKIYTSVSAMEADDEPVSDISGQPLRAGQIVVIASSDSDNGSVYRFGGISEGSSVWALVGTIGNIPPVDALDSDSTQLPLAAHQGKVLDGKISQLGQKVDDLPLIGYGVTENVFDYRTATNNRSISTDGSIIVRTDNILFITDYIDVHGNTKIYLNKTAHRIAFYDSSKQFVGINTSFYSTYDIPDGAYYAIVDFLNDYLAWADRAELMIAFSSITEFQSHYGAKDYVPSSIKTKSIADNAITGSKISENSISTQMLLDGAVTLSKRTASGSACKLAMDRPLDINFNTNKIRFPNSSNIYLYWGQSYYNVPANTEIEMDILFGSAYVAFDTSSKIFSTRRYGRAIPAYMGENEIFVFAISNYNVILDCPFTINGQDVTDISIYEKNSGIVDYDNTWWKVGTTNYKHLVIPIITKGTTISVTSIRASTYLMGLKSYTQPSENGPIQDISDVWVRRIEIPSGTTFNAQVPDDVKFIVLNVLYSNEDCISGLSVGSNNNPCSLHRLTIATHNVRDFSDGSGDGCPAALVQTNLPLWKEHCSNFLNTDFLTMLEWYPYFDRERTIDAYETLFKQFFPYKYELPAVNPTKIILSKYPGIVTDLNSFGPSLNFNMPMIICNIKGYKVAVVCWLQSSTDTAEVRIAAYNSAINILQDFDKVIVAGDFNTEQGLEELSVWTDAGYTLGNGGYWGEIATWSDKPNDNIITKGFTYELFEKGGDVSSDHHAVSAKLSYVIQG